MSPQIQQEGLQVEGEGGKEMVLIPLGEGLERLQGLARCQGMCQPGEEGVGKSSLEWPHKKACAQ